jgi:hypothetical protein
VRRILCVVAMALFLGCEGPSHPEAPPPEAVAPAYEPPPAQEEPLTREEVLLRGRAEDSDEAIGELDRHPFDFELDEPNLAWLQREGVRKPVLDYLHKRSKVDWDALRGDVDPQQVPGTSR